MEEIYPAKELRPSQRSNEQHNDQSFQNILSIREPSYIAGDDRLVAPSTKKNNMFPRYSTLSIFLKNAHTQITSKIRLNNI